MYLRPDQNLKRLGGENQTIFFLNVIPSYKSATNGHFNGHDVYLEKKVACSIQLKGQIRHLEALFTSDGKSGLEIDYFLWGTICRKHL